MEGILTAGEMQRDVGDFGKPTRVAFTRSSEVTPVQASVGILLLR